MQSLADFLRFLLPQTSSGTGGADPIPSWPKQSGEGEALGAGSFPPFNVFAQPLQNFGDQQPILGLGYIPFSNLGASARQLPMPNVPNSRSGGILGGLPFATGPASADSQPRGILGSYDMPERSQVGRPQPQVLGLQAPGAGLPLPPPLASSPLTAPDSTIGAPPVPPVALSNRPFAGQAFSPSPRFADRQSSQAGDLNPFGSWLLASLVSPRGLRLQNDADTSPEFPNAETYKKLNIGALIHYPDSVGSHVGIYGSWIPPAGERDWSAHPQPAQVVLPSALTGDSRIDRTTEILLDTLVEAVNELGVDPSAPMRSSVFGTLAHAHFGRKVKVLDLPGIGANGVEQTWHLGDTAKYGLSGAKRTDIYLRDRFGRPIAIYDLKTGNAQLTPARIRELRAAVGAGNIPVIQLQWRDVTALQP